MDQFKAELTDYCNQILGSDEEYACYDLIFVCEYPEGEEPWSPYQCFAGEGFMGIRCGEGDPNYSTDACMRSVHDAFRDKWEEIYFADPSKYPDGFTFNVEDFG